ncbi:MAG: hypothetical protein HC907_30115 [Richelia sp. SM1_7_0]|nr:hypothetical protein [Richelia sp. SM1_7_0]
MGKTKKKTNWGQKNLNRNSNTQEVAEVDSQDDVDNECDDLSLENQNYQECTEVITYQGYSIEIHDEYAILEYTKAYVEALSRSAGIPADLLIIEITTGTNDTRGTNIHF